MNYIYTTVLLCCAG